MRVGAGGAYFLISRSLGLELGGALGIPLYLSQALSVTLYSFGLAESVKIIWPGAPVQLLAALIVISVVAVASKSTVLALRMQLPIMLFIGLSVLSLVLGVDWSVDSTLPSFGDWEDAGFWQVFAVFFPAVTGILAGVGLSGDLNDPGKSIPRGVLSACAVGLLVYLVMPFVLSTGATQEQLRTDNLIWTKIAWAGWLVVPGLWGAVLSSALGSILGAPRTLQALAFDRLAPAAFGKVCEETGEPKLALWVSGTVALGAVALGDLNVVATVVSMFFLTTYGMLNLASGLESLVKDPSYRPRIRVPWWVSFIGAFGCFVAMFAINPAAFTVAVVVEIGIWWALSRRALKAAWGDLRTGLWYALVRFGMVQLREARMDPRNWRPQILVFTGDLEKGVGMVKMASHFSQDHGIVTVTTLLVGELEDHSQLEYLKDRNSKILLDKGIQAFPEVIAVPDLISGIMTVAQSNGFGGVSSNMVMFGWPDDAESHLALLLGHVRNLARLNKSSMIMRNMPLGSRGETVRKRKTGGELVVWWKGKEHNGDLMLLLAHLLALSKGASQYSITLKSIATTNKQAADIRNGFQTMLEEIRIEGRVEVVVKGENDVIVEMLRRHSRGADIVFMGLALPEIYQEQAYANRLIDMLEGLPKTVLVYNAGPFRGRLV